MLIPAPKGSVERLSATSSETDTDKALAEGLYSISSITGAQTSSKSGFEPNPAAKPTDSTLPAPNLRDESYAPKASCMFCPSYEAAAAGTRSEISNLPPETLAAVIVRTWL